MDCPPILLLIFNRPDLTRRVFARIQEVKPAKLFIAADGPRADRADETQLCAETRAIVDLIDWKCEVKTLFRDHNLGCRAAITSGINWFFEEVEEGIILEDDCLPDLSFFRFCGELLPHYRHDTRIMMISGSNLQESHPNNPASYYFSGNFHIWGWATWRRAWTTYDATLAQWPTLRQTDWLKEWHNNTEVAQHWANIFDLMYYHPIDTWDYQWQYTGWLQHGLAIQPTVNLISNIGFDPRATHTQDTSSALANRTAHAMRFPLVHPQGVIRNYPSERHTARQIQGIRPRWYTLLRAPYRQLRRVYQQVQRLTKK